MAPLFISKHLHFPRLLIIFTIAKTFSFICLNQWIFLGQADIVGAIEKVRVLRNPIIAQLLYDIEYIENWGSGVPCMKRVMLRKKEELPRLSIAALSKPQG